MNNEKENKIFKRLREDYDLLTNKGYLVIGVFLVGSQNYGVDDEFSDIDAKALVFPQINDLVDNKKLSTTVYLDNNEQIAVTDIRDAKRIFLKQNFNFLEILFTKYKILNPFFEDEIQYLFQFKENIARYDEEKTYSVMYHFSEGNYSYIVKNADKKENDVLTKKLSVLIRVKEFLEKFAKGLPYGECFVVDNADYIISIKRNSLNLSTNEILVLAEKFHKEIAEIYENKKTQGFEISNIKKEMTEDILSRSIKNCLIKYFKENLY